MKIGQVIIYKDFVVIDELNCFRVGKSSNLSIAINLAAKYIRDKKIGGSIHFDTVRNAPKLKQRKNET